MTRPNLELQARGLRHLPFGRKIVSQMHQLTKRKVTITTTTVPQQQKRQWRRKLDCHPQVHVLTWDPIAFEDHEYLEA